MTGPRDGDDGGPIPARDLLKPTGATGPDPESAERGASDEVGERPAAVAGAPAGEHGADGLSFDMDGAAWVARAAGAGSYGTGRLGAARLLAVHFFLESEPEAPVREALIPTGLFSTLRAPELRELFDRATPIDPQT